MRVNRRLFLGLGGALAVAACTPEPGTTSDPQPGGDVDNGELATRAPGDHFDPFGELSAEARVYQVTSSNQGEPDGRY